MGLRTPKQGSKRYRYLRSVRLRKPKPREFVKYQHCPAMGKVCYATQDEAILVLGKTQWSKDREKRHEKRVYQCPNCHQWHLTSVSQLSYRRYLHPREKAKVLLSRWKNLERFGGHRPKALDVYVERIDGYWTYSIAELDVRGKAETAAKAREYTRKVFPHDLLEVGLEFHYLHEKYSDIEHVYQRMCEQRYGVISQRAWREWMNKFDLEPEQVFVVPQAALKAGAAVKAEPEAAPETVEKVLPDEVEAAQEAAPKVAQEAEESEPPAPPPCPALFLHVPDEESGLPQAQPCSNGIHVLRAAAGSDSLGVFPPWFPLPEV